MTYTLGGRVITSAKVSLPRQGVWWADVETSESDAPESGVITLGGLVLRGTIVSGAPVYGRGRWRVCGGRGGWGRVLPPRGYSNDAGIKLQLLIDDASREVGETFAGTTSVVIGPHYARTEGVASRVLDLHGPWYVDEGGVTRVGSRERVTYAGDGTVSTVDETTRSVQTDDAAGLVPGVVVDGVEALDVEIELSASSLVARVFGARVITDALKTIVERSLPDLRGYALWEYRVVSQTGERLNLQSTTTRHGMPDLSNVFVRLAPGYRVSWPAGSLCVVAFIGADLSRPIVIGGDASGSPGWEADVSHVRASGFAVDLVESGVMLGRPLSAKDYVALAQKVDARFDALEQHANTHVHTSAAPGNPTSPAVAPLVPGLSTAASDVQAS